jgi:hypothetical protein
VPAAGSGLAAVEKRSAIRIERSLLPAAHAAVHPAIESPSTTLSQPGLVEEAG